eukprot:TRINITY_DN525_c0_g1_i3.p1 TRINITY_DN525_c0_g1~~TRINITY_DN525_c0_g1_i3.p1  ORF type:complete len:1176 (-),score=218.33 TRINITY_DN525_c0_g1_i3:521-4048(-)
MNDTRLSPEITGPENLIEQKNVQNRELQQILDTLHPHLQQLTKRQQQFLSHCRSLLNKSGNQEKIIVTIENDTQESESRENDNCEDEENREKSATESFEDLKKKMWFQCGKLEMNKERSMEQELTFTFLKEVLGIPKMIESDNVPRGPSKTDTTDVSETKTDGEAKMSAEVSKVPNILCEELPTSPSGTEAFEKEVCSKIQSELKNGEKKLTFQAAFENPSDFRCQQFGNLYGFLLDISGGRGDELEIVLEYGKANSHLKVNVSAYQFRQLSSEKMDFCTNCSMFQRERMEFLKRYLEGSELMNQWDAIADSLNIDLLISNMTTDKFERLSFEEREFFLRCLKSQEEGLEFRICYLEDKDRLRGIANSLKIQLYSGINVFLMTSKPFVGNIEDILLRSFEDNSIAEFLLRRTMASVGLMPLSETMKFFCQQYPSSDTKKVGPMVNNGIPEEKKMTVEILEAIIKLNVGSLSDWLKGKTSQGNEPGNIIPKNLWKGIFSAMKATVNNASKTQNLDYKRSHKRVREFVATESQNRIIVSNLPTEAQAPQDIYNYSCTFVKCLHGLMKQLKTCLPHSYENDEWEVHMRRWFSAVWESQQNDLLILKRGLCEWFGICMSKDSLGRIHFDKYRWKVPLKHLVWKFQYPYFQTNGNVVEDVYELFKNALVEVYVFNYVRRRVKPTCDFPIQTDTQYNGIGECSSTIVENVCEELRSKLGEELRNKIGWLPVEVGFEVENGDCRGTTIEDGWLEGKQCGISVILGGGHYYVVVWKVKGKVAFIIDSDVLPPNWIGQLMTKDDLKYGLNKEPWNKKPWYEVLGSLCGKDWKFKIVGWHGQKDKVSCGYYAHIAVKVVLDIIQSTGFDNLFHLLNCGHLYVREGDIEMANKITPFIKHAKEGILNGCNPLKSSHHLRLYDSMDLKIVDPLVFFSFMSKNRDIQKLEFSKIQTLWRKTTKAGWLENEPIIEIYLRAQEINDKYEKLRHGFFWHGNHLKGFHVIRFDSTTPPGKCITSKVPNPSQGEAKENLYSEVQQIHPPLQSQIHQQLQPHKLQIHLQLQSHELQFQQQLWQLWQQQQQWQQQQWQLLELQQQQQWQQQQWQLLELQQQQQQWQQQQCQQPGVTASLTDNGSQGSQVIINQTQSLTCHDRFARQQHQQQQNLFKKIGQERKTKPKFAFLETHL